MKSLPTARRGKLICIGGLPGAGKTTLGLGLMECFQACSAVLIDPDYARSEVLGTPGQPITDVDLRPDIRLKTISRMLEKAESALLQSKIVIVPTTFCGEMSRKQFRSLAYTYIADFYGFWLMAPLDIHQDRMRKRTRDREQGVQDLTTLSAVSAINIDPNKIEGTVDWVKIDANQPPGAILASTLVYLCPQPLIRPVFAAPSL